MSPAERTSAASWPSAWPSWPPKSAPPSVATIDCIGPSWARASVGHEVAHGADHAAGDRVAELLPDVEGVVDPLVAVPRGGGADAGGQRGDRVEPQVGEPQRLLDLACARTMVTAGSPDAVSWLAATWRARSQLTGPLPGRGEHLLQLRHELLHLLRVGGVGRLGARQGEAERDIRHVVNGTRGKTRC